MEQMILTTTDPNSNEQTVVISTPPDSIPPDTAPLPDHATVICTDGSVHVVGVNDVDVQLPEDCGDPARLPENQGVPVTEPISPQDTVAIVGESKGMPQLPATGSETEAMSAIGIAALVAGAMLVRLSRRPSHKLK